MKSVELDDYLGGSPVQYREVSTHFLVIHMHCIRVSMAVKTAFGEYVQTQFADILVTNVSTYHSES